MSSQIFAVWKYPLEIVGRQDVFMPIGYHILGIVTQHDIPTLYALVKVSGSETAKVVIRMIGTGHQYGSEINTWLYLGTVLTYEDNLVWHIFEEPTRGKDDRYRS